MHKWVSEGAHDKRNLDSRLKTTTASSKTKPVSPTLYPLTVRIATSRRFEYCPSSRFAASRPRLSPVREMITMNVEG